jgi:hypothetical protein
VLPTLKPLLGHPVAVAQHVVLSHGAESPSFGPLRPSHNS